MEKIIHFIITPNQLRNDKIKYRRRRLVNFLSDHIKTDKIIWIYPSINKFLTKTEPDKIYKNIYQLPISDPLPYHLTSLTPFTHNIFTKKVEKIIQSSSKNKKTYLWYTFPIFPGLVYINNWNKIIYDCSDNWGYSWKALAPGIRNKIKFWIDKLVLRYWKLSENKVIRNSDLVFTTSEYLKRKTKKKKAEANVYLVENGVEFKKFKTQNSIKKEIKEKFSDIHSPRLGYIGGIKQKINFSLLKDVAEMHPEWSFVFIGPKHNSRRFEEILNLENTYWLGVFSPEEIPSFCKLLDVGLMPYKNIEYNKGVFPLKFFEYLASGLPIVGCGLPSTKKYEKKGVYIHTKSNSEEFTKACKKVLNWENKKQERKKIAKKADWNNKLEFIVNTALKNKT